MEWKGRSVVKKIFYFEHMEDPSAVFDSRKMDNGETRMRLKFPNGGGYIRTEAAEGGWQNAHHHKGLRETFIVEHGWLALAENYHNGVRHVTVYRSGEIFTCGPGVDHNVFLPEGGVIHTIQYGKPIGNPDKKGNDWYAASPDFDIWSKALTIKGIADHAGVTPESLTE